MRFDQYITEAEQSDKVRWQKYLRSNKMLQAGVAVLDIIEGKGYTAYIVGGSVRDLVMGTEPHDIDISTNCPIEILEELFGKVYDIGQSKDFGIVVVKKDGFSFEVAQFRQDSYAKPKTVRKILK